MLCFTAVFDRKWFVVLRPGIELFRGAVWVGMPHPTLSWPVQPYRWPLGWMTRTHITHGSLVPFADKPGPYDPSRWVIAPDRADDTKALLRVAIHPRGLPPSNGRQAKGTLLPVGGVINVSYSHSDVVCLMEYAGDAEGRGREWLLLVPVGAAIRFGRNPLPQEKWFQGRRYEDFGYQQWQPGHELVEFALLQGGLWGAGVNMSTAVQETPTYDPRAIADELGPGRRPTGRLLAT